MRAPDAPYPMLALCLVGLALTACYQGGDREKEPPPGYAGGLCNAGACQDGSVCDPTLGVGVCYFPDDPCHGFYCGGEDRGACVPGPDNRPTCACNFEWIAEPNPLYCCPDPLRGNTAMDPVCTLGATAPLESSAEEDTSWAVSGSDPTL